LLGETKYKIRGQGSGKLGLRFNSFLPIPCGRLSCNQASGIPPISHRIMSKTVEYTNNRVSTIELLIHERSKGKSLRHLGQMFNRSHERIRQVLAKYDLQVTLLPENAVAAKLGYPVEWLTQLRKGGIVKPIKPGGYWLYSEEQVRQIPSLIAEARKCEQCGGQRPLDFIRFCRECSPSIGENTIYDSKLGSESKTSRAVPGMAEGKSREMERGTV